MDDKEIKEEQKIPKNINTGLVSLDIVSKMNNVDIDMRGIIREYGISTADISPEEIIRIAKNHAFKVKKKNEKIQDLSEKYPYPAIIQTKEGVYCVLLGIKPDEKRALVLFPHEKAPKSYGFDELQEQINDFVQNGDKENVGYVILKEEKKSGIKNAISNSINELKNTLDTLKIHF